MSIKRYDLVGDMDGNCNLNEARMEYSSNGSYVKFKDYAESERYGRQADITIENLERKVEQMAAENAGLKHATGQCKEYFTALVLNQLTPYNPAVMNGTCAIALSETPATDAFLAEVRARGVSLVISYHNERADALRDVDRDGAYRHESAALDAIEVLMKIREGAAK